MNRKKTGLRCSFKGVVPLVVLCVAAAFAGEARAVPIAVQYVDTHGTEHDGVAGDPVTGKWYRKTLASGTLWCSTAGPTWKPTTAPAQ